MFRDPVTLTHDALIRGSGPGGPGRVSFTDTVLSVDPGGTGDTGRLILPALCNAHDHGRGIRTVAFGAGDDTLELWISKLGHEPKTDPYLRAVVAFGRMALSGIGVLNHCHNTADPSALLDEARAVARAAQDIGIRVAFAVPIMGRNPITYGDPAPFLDALPPDLAAAQAARADRVRPWDQQLEDAEAIFELASPWFLPQYGPVGPQWVDDDVLADIADRSQRLGRRVHMHLFETQAQREWADHAYPGGLVRHLNSLGLLSPRLTVAHGVWLSPEDCEVLAARGVMVSVNTSSNLRLRSGIAPVKTFLEKGVGWGLGLDGMAFDDDEDALRELRLLWQLHRGFGMEDVMEADRLWQAVLSDGRRAILGPDAGGAITPGAPADLMVLNTTRMMHDVMRGRADVRDILLTRATKADVEALYVGGCAVVENHRLTGLDLQAAENALLAEARANLTDIDAAAIARIEAAQRHYYGNGCHCCTPRERQKA